MVVISVAPEGATVGYAAELRQGIHIAPFRSRAGLAEDDEPTSQKVDVERHAAHMHVGRCRIWGRVAIVGQVLRGLLRDAAQAACNQHLQAEQDTHQEQPGPNTKRKAGGQLC